MLIVLGTFPVSIEISLVDRFTRNKVARYFSPCVKLGCRSDSRWRNSWFFSSTFISKVLFVLSPFWYWLMKALTFFRWGINACWSILYPCFIISLIFSSNSLRLCRNTAKLVASWRLLYNALCTDFNSSSCCRTLSSANSCSDCSRL